MGIMLAYANIGEAQPMQKQDQELRNPMVLWSWVREDINPTGSASLLQTYGTINGLSKKDSVIHYDFSMVTNSD